MQKELDTIKFEIRQHGYGMVNKRARRPFFNCLGGRFNDPLPL